jgi:hypothetical protein
MKRQLRPKMFNSCSEVDFLFDARKSDGDVDQEGNDIHKGIKIKARSGNHLEIRLGVGDDLLQVIISSVRVGPKKPTRR